MNPELPGVGEFEAVLATCNWTEWFADGTKSFEGTRKRTIVKERWTGWHERVQESLDKQE